MYFVDIGWERQLQKVHMVGVTYSPLFPHVRIQYEPNLSWKAGWLEEKLIVGEIKKRTGATEINQTNSAKTIKTNGRLFPEMGKASPPWQIGIAVDRMIVARQQYRPSDVIGIATHAARPDRSNFVTFKDVLINAAKRYPVVTELLDHLLHVYVDSRSKGHLQDDLSGGSNVVMRDGFSTEALVLAAGTALSAFVRNELEHGQPPIFDDALIVDHMTALERLGEAAQELNELFSARRDQFLAKTEDELTEAWTQAKEALLLTTLFRADETVANAHILDDVSPLGITPQVRATILNTLQMHAVRMVRDGSIFALEANANQNQPVPAHVLDEFNFDTDFGEKDPWEEIWAIYQAGEDDIVVPARDYDYAAKFNTLLDPETGRVLEPLSDPTVPNVMIRIPPEQPFPFADEKRRRVVPLMVEKQLLRITEYFRELYVADIPTWSVPQAFQQALQFMYVAIKKRFAGLGLEPYYLRGFRLFRWYAEKALYDKGKYMLQRTFQPWIAPIPSGFLDMPWSGSGVSFMPGKIICETGELIIDLTTQVNEDVTITLTVPANATATIKRTAGDLSLTNGSNVVPLTGIDKIHLTFATVDSPVEITYLDRDGYWLQEYTITPVFEVNAADDALTYWNNMLMTYYDKHHELKTKGARYLHLHS